MAHYVRGKDGVEKLITGRRKVKEMKEKCGCKLFHTGYDDIGIDYCPLHEAAPLLYEALKAIQDENMLKLASNLTQCGVLIKINKAFAQVEEKK